MEQVGNSRLDEYQIDLSVAYAEPNYTLYQNGTGTMPRGDIMAIKAKSKNGKSYLASVFTASVFGITEYGFSSADTNATVIYFDTEQNERNTAKLAKRVHTLLGWDELRNHPHFMVYSLRKADTAKRKQVIIEAVTKHKPAIAFVDGIADIIEDFNDVGQSTQIINDFMKLSADNDCAICCILHENKKAEDKGMKGHLGTLLLQKASDVYEIVRDGVQFNVTETDSRNIAIDDFSFMIDDAGLPRRADTKDDVKQKARVVAIRNTMAEIFAKTPELTFTELKEAYCTIGCCEDRTASRRIKEAKEYGIIDVTLETKKYRLKCAECQNHPP